MQDAMFKVCLFGDGGVGKTTLISRYLTDVFKGGSEITIGVDFHIKKMEIQEKRISLQIWDFAGEERFRFLLPSYVLGASGGIFMFDITRYSSLRNFQDWLNIVRQGYKGPLEQIPILMVGSKLDLEYKRAVSRDEAFELAKKNNLFGYIECSSKDGQNVQEVFLEIARIMMKKAKIITT
ncbi:MAG: GTP-binding protein [Candidatus Lokiarchaeota archaeon]|nr:GTP-binding protein [Candidatus Lokiarchaeota archaeon]